MDIYLQHLAMYSLSYALAAILLVSFFESLALLGLILPGTVMMAALGTLIGSGHVGFFPAWGAAGIGAVLGDWLSYFLGRFFKTSLQARPIVQRYAGLLNRVEQGLNRHSVLTILLGRLIGPTRPVVPLVAGMLNLSPYKFALPNIIGCLIWPVIYFFPGILAGVAMTIPADNHNTLFKGLLLSCLGLLWLSSWLAWHWQRRWRFAQHRLPRGLTPANLPWVSTIAMMLTIANVIALAMHPLLSIYGHVLMRVFQL